MRKYAIALLLSLVSSSSAYGQTEPTTAPALYASGVGLGKFSRAQVTIANPTGRTIRFKMEALKYPMGTRVPFDIGLGGLAFEQEFTLDGGGQIGMTVAGPGEGLTSRTVPVTLLLRRLDGDVLKLRTVIVHEYDDGHVARRLKTVFLGGGPDRGPGPGEYTVRNRGPQTIKVSFISDSSAIHEELLAPGERLTVTVVMAADVVIKPVE